MRAAMLTPVTANLSKGDRVLALGHPRDLGLSIVEGTYNGQVEHVLTPRLHFTGPLNPGMSGGPAVTPAGALVGVNVATMGEELAFLVPAEFVTRLLDRLPAVLPAADALRQRHGRTARAAGRRGARRPLRARCAHGAARPIPRAQRSRRPPFSAGVTRASRRMPPTGW